MFSNRAKQMRDLNRFLESRAITADVLDACKPDQRPIIAHNGMANAYFQHDPVIQRERLETT
jgi:hypothetical protein